MHDDHDQGKTISLQSCTITSDSYAVNGGHDTVARGEDRAGQDIDGVTVEEQS